MASLKQLEKRKTVDEIVSDEPGEYYVYLVPGFQVQGQGNEIEGCHGFGADSLAEIADVLKHQIVVCNCRSCQ